jgi:hypothetical protein
VVSAYIHFEDLIRQGVVTDYADLARLGHVTRARVTQIMNLRMLAPKIQEQLLDNSERSRRIQETVRLKTAQMITRQFSWIQQRELWHVQISRE